MTTVTTCPPEYAETPRQRMLWLMIHMLWSAEKFETERVMSERNVRNVVKNSDWEPNALTAEVINRIWQRELLQAPISIAADILISLNFYFDEHSGSQLRRDLLIVEQAIAYQLTITADPLEKSALHMAGGHVHRARFAILKDGKAHVSLAVDSYMTAVACLMDDKSPAANVLRIRGLVNAFTADYDARPPGRHRDPAVKQSIRDKGLIKGLLVACAMQPDNWRAARAGLGMASVLERKWIARRFWALLIHAKPAMADVSFSPGSELKSIKEDHDFEFVMRLFKRNELSLAFDNSLKGTK